MESGIHDIEISAGYNSPYLDLTTPVIRNVKSDGKKITWDTNQDSDSIVYYSTKSKPTIKDLKVLGRETARREEHKINISKTLSDQKLFYAVASTDKNGRSGWDDNSGAYYSVFVNYEGS